MSKYTKLAEFGKELLNKTSLTEGLPFISDSAKEITEADRCSIFIYNLEKNELWTTVADGVEKIIVDSAKGIVGYTIKTKEPVIENDAYSNPHFLPDIDEKTGYRTDNVATVPIFNSQREVLGVMQLLNKKDGFDSADAKFMKFFAHYISGFLELVNLYDEIENRSH